MFYDDSIRQSWVEVYLLGSTKVQSSQRRAQSRVSTPSPPGGTTIQSRDLWIVWQVSMGSRIRTAVQMEKLHDRFQALYSQLQQQGRVR